MTLRKIDAMHHFYGAAEGRCKDCPHFARKKYDKTYFKCLVYGASNSEATDWRAGYPACGLISQPFPEQDVRIVRLVSPARHLEETPGQMSMF